MLLFGNYTGALDLPQPAEYIDKDLRKAVGDDPMPFTLNELLYCSGQLVMVVDHHNKTLGTMEFSKMSGRPKAMSKLQLIIEPSNLIS